VLDQIEQRRLGPMQFIDDQHHRPGARQTLHQPAQRPQRLLRCGRRARLNNGRQPAQNPFAIGVALAGQPDETFKRGRLLTC
jgi:hypothetical protein